MAMKAKSTIQKQIRQLRKFIDDPANDALETRVAYAIETALRWTIEDVVAWPTRVEDAIQTANLIRAEWR